MSRQSVAHIPAAHLLSQCLATVGKVMKKNTTFQGQPSKAREITEEMREEELKNVSGGYIGETEKTSSPGKRPFRICNGSRGS